MVTSSHKLAGIARRSTAIRKQQQLTFGAFLLVDELVGGVGAAGVRVWKALALLGPEVERPSGSRVVRLRGRPRASVGVASSGDVGGDVVAPFRRLLHLLVDLRLVDRLRGALRLLGVGRVARHRRHRRGVDR